MQLQDVEKLIQSGESEAVEFKKYTGQRTTTAKTLCGMLNGTEGMILFGVNYKLYPTVFGLIQQELSAGFSERKFIHPVALLP